ncbi:MAG: FKBP-type peptidyl-prolyl cis-trans isomerase FkpA precursor [Chitinophagaceae bacterium]|jgi:FKBP-type peptidyl-prolyl cis-trans isomerase|nr:FKBP-type peptidyl-prolyl cis-trans isomerase FkpA precursor [Chitinophagaceae bacterium]
MRNLVVLIAGALILGSCNSGYEKTKSGARFKIVESKGGKLIKLKDIVRMDQVILIPERDTILYNTHGQMPSYMGIDTARNLEYVQYTLSEVLMRSKVGDSVVVVFSSDSLAMRTNPQTGKREAMYNDVLQRGGFVTMRIRVNKSYANDAEVGPDLALDREKENQRRTVERKAAQEKWMKEMQEKHQAEIREIEAYLQKNNIKTVKTPLGVYVEVQQAGTPPIGQVGAKAEVNYTGRLLKDGKAFDSNVDPSFEHPFPMGVVIGGGGVIPGFDDGLRYFGKGGRGRIFIPSYLGYGEEGSKDRIPPNATLIFEVEMKNIAPADAAGTHSPGDGHTDH